MHNYQKIEQQPLLHLCITEPLRLGKAEIIRENEHGILTYCPCAKFYCLSANDAETARTLLAHAREEIQFIMLLNADFAPLITSLKLKYSMKCHQAAYLKANPPLLDSRLHIEIPDDRAFARILEVYHMDTPEELRRRRETGELFFARDENGCDAGFVGLHPEGCFGLLEVFPEHRGKGYGTALESFIIRFCMESGRIPYCQVEESNAASMALQKKLGLEIATETMLMAWNNLCT